MILYLQQANISIGLLQILSALCRCLELALGQQVCQYIQTVAVQVPGIPGIQIQNWRGHVDAAKVLGHLQQCRIELVPDRSRAAAVDIDQVDIYADAAHDFAVFHLDFVDKAVDFFVNDAGNGVVTGPVHRVVAFGIQEFRQFLAGIEIMMQLFEPGKGLFEHPSVSGVHVGRHVGVQLRSVHDREVDRAFADVDADGPLCLQQHFRRHAVQPVRDSRQDRFHFAQVVQQGLHQTGAAFDNCALSSRALGNDLDVVEENLEADGVLEIINRHKMGCRHVPGGVLHPVVDVLVDREGQEYAGMNLDDFVGVGQRLMFCVIILQSLAGQTAEGQNRAQVLFGLGFMIAGDVELVQEHARLDSAAAEEAPVCALDQRRIEAGIQFVEDVLNQAGDCVVRRFDIVAGCDNRRAGREINIRRLHVVLTGPAFDITVADIETGDKHHFHVILVTP